MLDSGIIIATNVIPLLIVTLFILKIEQKSGYYKCKHCHYKYVSTCKSVFYVMYIGRIRYVKCPKCSKKSCNKKVLTK